MPEGPSILLVKEAIDIFASKKIISVTGNTTTIDKNILLNQKIIEFKTWGKHLLICFKNFSIRIHFMMFGSYSVTEKKEKLVRLGLHFKKGDLYFYTCSVKLLEGDINQYYEWDTDVMNVTWDEKKAKQKLKQHAEKMICDVLLDQSIFSGVGNIIKNEILYRCKVHPESIIKNIPARALNKLIKEARNYSFEFLAWKRDYVLKKHWQVYAKKICEICKNKIIRKQTGVKKRRSFFCSHCQKIIG